MDPIYKQQRGSPVPSRQWGQPPGGVISLLGGSHSRLLWLHTFATQLSVGVILGDLWALNGSPFPMSLSVGGTGWYQELGQLRPHSPLGHSPRLPHASPAAEATPWDFSFSFRDPVPLPARLNCSLRCVNSRVQLLSHGALREWLAWKGRGSSPVGTPFTCWEKHKPGVWWGWGGSLCGGRGPQDGRVQGLKAGPRAQSDGRNSHW